MVEKEQDILADKLQKEAQSIFMKDCESDPARNDPALEHFIPLVSEYAGQQFDQYSDKLAGGENPLVSTKWGCFSLRIKKFESEIPFEVKYFEARWDQGRWSVYATFLDVLEFISYLEISHRSKYIKAV